MSVKKNKQQNRYILVLVNVQLIKNKKNKKI